MHACIFLCVHILENVKADEHNDIERWLHYLATLCLYSVQCKHELATLARGLVCIVVCVLRLR